MKKLPLTNKHLFHIREKSPLSRGFIVRDVNKTRSEQMYFGASTYENKEGILYATLIHALWDDVFDIEGIQIVFNDDKYDFGLD